MLWLICFGRACGGETMRCLCDREGRFNFSNTVHSFLHCCQQMSRCNRNLFEQSRHGIQHDRQLWTFAPPSWRDVGAKFFASRNLAWHSNGGSSKQQSSHDVATYTTVGSNGFHSWKRLIFTTTSKPPKLTSWEIFSHQPGESLSFPKRQKISKKMTFHWSQGF